MGPIQWFLFVYVLGGLTFIPLLLGVILYVGWRSLPIEDSDGKAAKANDPAELARINDDELVLKTATDDLASKFRRKHDADVAAGYFAVCREWVPGGVNGKPPDRLSPAGETIAQESPSVYQTMYRSLFDRSQKPTIEPHKDGAGKNVKKANNIFYVVLRHGHLMLYDDIQQLEVRYVISLEYHTVDVYAGSEEVIPEGELWVKRHAIRLSRKRSKDSSEKLSLPFFLFSENLSEKEDFYHALLKNQEHSSPDVPIAEDFDTSYIVKLVQKLHSSEEQLQTRWLNALIGRLFLATYKTPEVEDFMRSKLTKKISRVKKPAFITRISLHHIDTGSEAPFLTNPRLKDLTVNGDCVAEMDVEYTGGFRIEIGATARIDLGKRFGAREVDMLLAVTLKRVQGHLLVRFKPPPSNRLWFTFEKMPQMDLSLEPIVSSRKITYNIILNAMESRIREVFAESLVLPFWDDIPFLDTAAQTHRGGIWKREKTETTTEIKDETPEDEAETAAGGTDGVHAIKASAKNFSVPALVGDSIPVHSKSVDSKSLTAVPASDAITADGTRTPPGKVPRALRSPSFANVADPMLTANHVDSGSNKSDLDATPKREAAAVLKDLSVRRGSPSDPHTETPANVPAMTEALKGRSSSNASKASDDSARPSTRASNPDSAETSMALGSTSRPSTPSSAGIDSKRSSTYDESRPPKSFTQTARSMTAADRKQALASATAAAQKWGSSLGWGVLKNKKDGSAPDRTSSTTSTTATPSEPMGRGQPLPPPGQPLPRPPKSNIMSNIPFMATGQKKPASALPKRPEPAIPSTSAPPKVVPAQPPPLPERRRRKSTMHEADHGSNGEEVLVVEAPAESLPNSPEAERNSNRDGFFGPGVPHVLQDSARESDEQSNSSSPLDPNGGNHWRQDPMVKASPDLTNASGRKSNEETPSSTPPDKEPDSEVHSFRSQAAHTIEALPRPPPPARTGSDGSERRSSRTSSHMSSNLKERSGGLVRQPSNLSLHSTSDALTGDGEGAQTK